MEEAFVDDCIGQVKNSLEKKAFGSMQASHLLSCQW
jgi:hypothetical protein